MTDVPLPVIFNFFSFLFIPFIFAVILRKLKLSPIVGYLLGGVVLGNLFTRFISLETINNLAYFGIILLLFTVGLEIHFGRLFTLKRFIILGGTLQLLFSALLVAILALIFRFSPLESFLIGIALSSSSTALVAKIIQDRGEEHTFLGELAIGILMFQDIAFIPFMIIFTSISLGQLSLLGLVFNTTKSIIESALIIVILFYLGQKIIPQIFNKISRTSRELLNLFVIIFIFFVAYLSLLLKIPILIGVFVAGVLLAQTIEHHHIFSEVRPLRDLLAVIFFVFIGTHIQLPLIIDLLPKIVFFTFLVTLIKIAVVLFIFLFFRFHSRTAFLLSLYLFQIDEDAFILMSVAFFNKVISQETYLFIITSVLLTLVITPVLLKNKDNLYLLIRGWIKKYLPFLEKFIVHRIDRDISPIDVLPIKNHVIICGYGRVGSYIGRSLILANIPFVAIDYNFHLVEKAKKEGVNIIYGDPTDAEILDFAQIEEAAVIVLALPERLSQEAIILISKKLNPEIFIISRAHRETDQRRLRDLGVDVVVQPEFEASLSIIKKIYLLHRLPKDEALNKIRRLKLEYGMV